MNMFKKKWKKAIEKCKSMNDGKRVKAELSKSRSWPSTCTPQGCFAVYVGPDRRRFVVSAEQSTHPLFRMLLEDAEMEYGHSCQGPLLLPCDVDLFCKVLAEMVESHDDEILLTGACLRSPRAMLGYSPLTPSKMLNLNHF